MEITDEARVKALAAALCEAEAACGLSSEGQSLGTRADCIVRHAAESGLDPRLYRLAWMIRKWSKDASGAARRDKIARQPGRE
jgi:hypothetical protein